jgi:RNA polymerase sigma-70 factor (ECF subfamily)
LDPPPKAAAAATEPLEALLARAARGDESALRSLYDRTSRRVFGLALRILGDRVAAEEVALEVYVQVWQQAGRFQPSLGSPLAWIATMARTRAIDRVRARARRGLRETRLDERSERLVDDAPGPLEAFEGREHACAVRAAVLSLPTEQRRVIEAAYFGGLSHTEVAAALGQPLGTVKTRIRAGLQSLRRALNAPAVPSAPEERFA